MISAAVRIARIKPGCIEGPWSKENAVVPAGRLDLSRVPDYNAVVEVVPMR